MPVISYPIFFRFTLILVVRINPSCRDWVNFGGSRLVGSVAFSECLGGTVILFEHEQFGC